MRASHAGRGFAPAAGGTIVVPGYSFNTTDFTGAQSEITTGTWIQIHQNSDDTVFRTMNDNSFQKPHSLPSDGRFAEGWQNAGDEYTRFMVLVVDGDKRQIKLIDGDGLCYKRYYTDDQYFINQPGCNCDDEFSNTNSGRFFRRQRSIVEAR